MHENPIGCSGDLSFGDPVIDISRSHSDDDDGGDDFTDAMSAASPLHSNVGAPPYAALRIRTPLVFKVSTRMV